MPTGRDSWYQTDLAKAVVVIILSVTGATGVQMQFPVRQGAWTLSNHEEYAKRIEARHQNIEDRIFAVKKQMQHDRDMLRAYSDANHKTAMNELEKEALAIRLWVSSNYLPVDTPIPPPEVSSRLDRSERIQERHADAIDDLKSRMSECCYNRKTEFNALETK